MMQFHFEIGFSLTKFSPIGFFQSETDKKSLVNSLSDWFRFLDIAYIRLLVGVLIWKLLATFLREASSLTPINSEG